MAVYATDPSHSEAKTARAIEAGTERPPGIRVARELVLSYWPLAAIGCGLLASVAWSAGLLYGAYLLVRWLLN